MDKEDLIALIKELLDVLPELNDEDRETTLEHIDSYLKELKDALSSTSKGS